MQLADGPLLTSRYPQGGAFGHGVVELVHDEDFAHAPTVGGRAPDLLGVEYCTTWLDIASCCRACGRRGRASRR